MAPDRIVTLTLNPSVDIASDADGVRPVRKVRTRDETFDPGGGGVNVSRVLRELGADTLAVVAAGGVSGRLLEELLGEGGVPHEIVPTAGRTRISYTVHDLGVKQEYRFVPEGPIFAERNGKPRWARSTNPKAAGSSPAAACHGACLRSSTPKPPRGRQPWPAFRARHLRRAAPRRDGQGARAHQAEPGRVQGPRGRAARHARGQDEAAIRLVRKGLRNWSR